MSFAFGDDKAKFLFGVFEDVALSRYWLLRDFWVDFLCVYWTH